MAVAGKVAITLSTENGGAWSADVTYDRLVAVKHNNNLYISRKTVANVEPPNNEFWFLALEGFSGDDIEDIINGTTQVGNAKTLDGHGADEFLQTSGGTVKVAYMAPITLENTNSDVSLTAYKGKGALLGYLGMSALNKPCFQMADGTRKELLHTGNKPTGSYTGNGSNEQRTVNVGGTGSALLILGSGYSMIAMPSGAIGLQHSGGNIIVVPQSECKYLNGTLTLATLNYGLNANNATYNYQLL